MRNTCLALALLWLVACAASAAVPRTQIVGTIYHPSGAVPSNATITVKLSSPITVDDTITGSAGKHLITPVSQTIAVNNPSNCSFYLVPNTGSGASPSGTTYSVKIQSNLGVFSQIWQVPTSGSSVRVADIVVATAGSATSNYVPVEGGAFTGLVTFQGAPSFRLLPMAAPSSGNVTGTMYFDLTANAPKYYTGSTYVTLGGNLSQVQHDSTLTGDGTGGSPLGVDTSALSHNGLAGLTSGDPHTQYILVAGSRAFTGDQSFGGFQATNLKLENRTADVTGAVTGRIWIDTTIAGGGLLKWNDGDGVVNPLSRSFHTGTQLKSTISDFAHAATHNTGGGDSLETYYLLLAGGTMTGSLGMGGNTITNFRADPQGSDPGVTAGRIWFNTGSNVLKWGDGTNAIDPLDRQYHTGTYNTTVDFGEQVAANFRVENVTSNPAAGYAGRLMYNTVSQKLQLDTGSSVGDIGVSASVVTLSPISGNGLAGAPLTLTTGAVDHNALLNLTAGDPHTQYIKHDGTRAFTGNQSFGGFQLVAARVENIAGAAIPAASGGNKGRVYLDTTNNELVYSDGTDNVSVTATPANNGVVKANGSGKIAYGWNIVGSTASTLCAGDDSRLSDSRTPTAHAASHQGGADDLSGYYLRKAGGTMSGNIDFNQNQAVKMRLENLGSAPAAGNEGRIYWDTATKTLKIDNGTSISGLLGSSSLEYRQETVSQGAATAFDGVGLSVSVSSGVATVKPTGDVGKASQKYLNSTDGTNKAVIVRDDDGLSVRATDNTEGDLRRTQWVTTTNTAAATLLTFDGAAGSSSNTLTLASGTTHSYRIRVTARATAGTNSGKSAAYEFLVLASNTSGTTALVNAVSKTMIGEDSAVTAWDAAVTASDTDDRLEVKGTGDATTTVKWVATVEETTI